MLTIETKAFHRSKSGLVKFSLGEMFHLKMEISGIGEGECTEEQRA